ncbi:MAG: hypothetical protein WD469_00190 [Paenibacillaceae bacterium]
MTDQELKMNESKYFLGLMEDSMQQESYEHFTFNLSAFLAAARSILQYTLDRSKAAGKQIQFDNLVTGKPILKYFKDKRDVSIHQKPVRPIQQVNISVHSSIIIRVTESSKILKVDSNGNKISETVNPTIDPENAQGSTENPTTKLSPTRETEYRFNDWPGNENVLQLSQLYLQDLQTFMNDAQAARLI